MYRVLANCHCDRRNDNYNMVDGKTDLVEVILASI